MITIIIVASLTFVVHFVGTIAYSPRLTGVLSGKLSLSTSLSNILNIVSRSASVLMIPLLSKKIEAALLVVPAQQTFISNDYLLIFLFAFIGSVAGFICFEPAVKVLYYTVNAYTSSSNILLLLVKSVIAFPANKNFSLTIQKTKIGATDLKYLFLNCLVTCVYTSATLAAIYSAYAVPQFRVTSLSFAFIINGIATFIYVTVIDPYVSSLTDEAMADKTVIPTFYFRLRCFLYSRLTGVALSVFTFHFFLLVIVKCIGIMK